MTSSDIINPDPHTECDGCPLVPDRREFLRSAAALALGVISLSLPIRSVSAKVLTSAVGGRNLLSYKLPATDGADIDRDNEVILVRYQNEVYAFSLGCPHQNVSLRWNETDMRFQCPKHHSQYKPDGTFIDGRATRAMDRFAVTHDGANLVVNLDKVFEDDRDHTGWLGAAVPA